MMRSDFLMYIAGIVLITAGGYAVANKASLETPMGGMLIYSAVIFVLFLFGVTFLIFGYNQRPKRRYVVSIQSTPTDDSLADLAKIKVIGKKGLGS